MKKIISLSLMIALTFLLGAAMVSCEEHVCEFKEEWESNQTHHWHECTGDNCLETSGMSEHEWGEGIVNDEATTETTLVMIYTCKTCSAAKEESTKLEGAEEWVSDQTHHWHVGNGDNGIEIKDKAEHEWDDGVIDDEATSETILVTVYTCNVCSATKEESVELEGAVEEEEWEVAVAEQKFDNVTINYTFDSEEDGKQDHIVKITEDKVFRHISGIAPDGEAFSQEITFEGDDSIVQRNLFLSMFISLLAEKENFIYDMELKAYKMPNEVQTKVELGNGFYTIETMRDGVVTFDKTGNVTSFVFWISEASYHTPEGQEDELLHVSRGTVTLYFSDYGTTVIE